MKKVIGVVLSVLFCPLFFLGCWWFWFQMLTTPAPLLAVALSYALGTAIYFLWAGKALSRWTGLGRAALCLWMLLLGYPLCWGAMLLCFPALPLSSVLIIQILIITAVIAGAWAIIAVVCLLARQLLRLLRTPPAVVGRRVRSSLLALWRVASMGLLVGSLACLWVGGQGYLTLRPAEAYADRGVHTFVARSVYPTSETVRSGSRQRTRTVYKLEYKSKNGQYKYTERVPAESIGKEYIREKRSQERRVLSIPEEKKYITVAPEYTPESYVQSQRRRFLTMFGASAAYLTGAAVVFIWRRQRDEPRITATE